MTGIEKPEQRPKTCDSYCKGCEHLRTCGAYRCCEYQYDVGHCRPCPAGKGCTEHTRLKEKAEETARKRKWQTAPPPLSSSRPQKLDRKRARALYDSGASDKEIAETYSVSETTVRRWRYENGLLRKPNNGRRKDQ